MTSVPSVVHSDPDILGGTPVFVGTRVPVRTLLDYLAAGDSLDEFLDHFPTVSRNQAVGAGAGQGFAGGPCGILLDECVPRPLRRELVGHDVGTIQEMGWAGKKNGELIALMAGASFEVLLTVDQNLRHQQNLAAVGVAVVVMVAPSNRLADLVPLVPAVQVALVGIQGGDVVEVRP